MTICIFDIDNTLYRSSTVRSFLPYALREGAFPLKFFLALPFYLLRFFFRGVTPALLGKQFPLMQGISEQQMKAAAKITYQKKIRPGLDTVLLKEIEMQRKAGNKILLASSSFYPVIEPLLKELRRTPSSRRTLILKTVEAAESSGHFRLSARGKNCGFFSTSKAWVLPRIPVPFLPIITTICRF
ncbi:MAG: haloacid dehalogenase-like hydrolase [Candidatus Neomarinimicrobiota bacterium]